MRILHFDAFSGISGDMTVGALLDLGANFQNLQEQLGLLAVHGYSLRSEERVVRGIRARKFDVDIDDQHLTHDHAAHEQHAAHQHHHRSFREIRKMIEASALPVEVREKALAIFSRLAEAEGRVHGKAPEEVEFHEVGAIDSIVDIVGTAIGLVELGVESITVSSLPLGSGTVQCQHGIIPVPGPATVELLKEFPVRIGDGEGEMVTPTGAAILAALAKPAVSPPPMRIERVGYGAGTRVLSDRSNVLRAILGESISASDSDEMLLLETNIDDLNPEIYEHVIDLLFAAGARDVWMTAIQMKKNRPGTMLSVLSEPAHRDMLSEIILGETSTIGVRTSTVQRTILPRRIVTVETEFGTVSVKIADGPGKASHIAPEYESCRAAARQHGVPLRAVYDAALRAAAR